MFESIKQVLKASLQAVGPSDFREPAWFVTGRYNIGNVNPRTNERIFLACRAENITAHSMNLTVPVVGRKGTPITVQFDEFGELKGEITGSAARGFDLDIKATDEERARLKARIAWIKTNKKHAVSDQRKHKRVVPREPISTLVFADGETPRCFVIDMSAAGAAVSAPVAPPIGTPLALGMVIGRVVRHLPDGFAIRFIDTQPSDRLEHLLIKPPETWRRKPGRTPGAIAPSAR